MLALKPGWMDGKPVYIWIGHAISLLALSVGTPKASMVFVFGLYSAVFASLTSVNLYFICRSLFRRRYMGIVPGLFTALSPIGFTSSILIAPYPMALFFATLAVVTWLQKRFLTWSIAWALAICSHASSILLAFMWLGLLLTNRDRRLAKRAFTHLAITFVICLAFFGWVVLFYPSLDMFIRFNVWVTNKDYMLPVTDQWLSDRIAALTQGEGAFLLMFSVIGAFLVFIRKIKPAWSMFWWLVPYLAFYLLWGQGKYEKFYVFILPVLAILATSAVEILSDDLKNVAWNPPSGRGKTLQGVLVLLLVILTLSGGLVQGYRVVASTKTEPNEYSELALGIDRWAKEENLSSNPVIIAGIEAHYIIFYASGVRVLGWYGTIFPDDESQIAYLVLLNIDRAHANGQRVFMTKIWYYEQAAGNPSLSFATSFIAEHYRIVETNDMLLEVI
jgi:hypothetical protein